MSPLLENPLLHRMGLTVLHALWELALIALLVWVGLHLLRRRSARSRYLLACGGLAVMVLGPILTWFLIAPSTLMDAQLIQAVGTIAGEATPTKGAFTFSEWLYRINGMAPWAAVLWCVGFTLMLARLGAGLWWLDRAYLATAFPASQTMQAMLNRLAERMGVTQSVRLLESAKAESPLLLGWLKPAILVPSAALLQLSPTALEAILAHELAHVRRFDYLVNLLQSFVEALLFFHPCVWWLSSRIRELREHCCDDAAALLCGDPLILAEGLSALERLRRRIQSDPEPALAAAKGNLMSRITRLFQPQEAPAASLRGLALALVGASLLGAAAITAQQAKTTEKPAASRPEVPRLRITFQPAPPPYPSEARNAGVQGLVVLHLRVDAEGGPAGIQAVQGPMELRETAVAYAKGWRFEPRPGDGELTFQLNLLFGIGDAGSSAKTLAQIPEAKVPSATVQILAAAKTPTGLTEVDFAQIEIAHKPPAPAYPVEAKALGIQGTVVVQLTVDEQGVPISTEALEGPPQLHPTAITYAQSWRFEPVRVSGKAVKARFKLTMPFRLRGEDPAPKVSQGKVDATPGEAQDTDFSRIKIALKPPAPAYPAEAKAQRIQGIVVVEITVNEQGVPVGVRALSGPEELRSTAMGYAEQWRFQPHKVNGKPVKARFKLTMPFRLR